MRKFLTYINMLLICGLSLNASATQSKADLPIATQVTINYYVTSSDLDDINLLLTAYDQSYYGFWDPVPLASIAPNSQSPEHQPTLKTEIKYNYYGSISYGISKHCTPDLKCDPDYQFTVKLSEQTCSVNKTEMNDGTVEHTIKSSFDDAGGESEIVYCTIDIQAAPVTPEPPDPPTSASMQIQIANQIGLNPGTGQYSYQLQNGEAQAQQGSFNPPDLINVPVDTNPAPIVSTLTGLEPEADLYQGRIIYTFDDRPNAQNQTSSLQINLDNTQSSNINDWCTADIANVDASDRIYYLESVEVTETDGVANCTITIAADFSPPNYEFVQVYTLPTTGVLQLEYFNIDNQDYLAAGSSLLNIWGGANDIYSYNVFAVSPNSYNSKQLIDLRNCYLNNNHYNLVNHAYGFKYFTINNTHRIMMINKQMYTYPANNECQFLTWDTLSPIYPWSSSGKQFDLSSRIELSTDSPVMAEFYEINNSGVTQYYLAVAESHLANKSVMTVYLWNGSGFTKTTQDLSALGTYAVTDITQFNADGQTYLIVTQPDAAQVTLFKVGNDGSLTNANAINVSGVKNALIFAVNNQQFLIFGYQALSTTAPSIYQWQSSSATFVPIQTLPSSFSAAQAWQAFSADGLQFLVGAFGTGGVKAFYWSAEAQELQTQYKYPSPLGDCVNNGNVVNLTAFVMSDANYVALACYTKADGNPQLQSPVVKWQSK